MYKQVIASLSVALLFVSLASAQEVKFNHTSKEITFANLHYTGTNLKFNLTNGWARFLGGSQTGNKTWYLDFSDYDGFTIQRVHSNASANWYNLTMRGLLRRVERDFCFDLSFSDATWYHLPSPGVPSSKVHVDTNVVTPRKSFTAPESVYVNSNGFAIGALKTDDASVWQVSQQRLAHGRPNLCWTFLDKDPNSFPGHNAIFNFFIIAGRTLDEVAKFTGNLTLFK